MVEQLGEVGQGLVIPIREHDHIDFLEAGGHLGHVHPLEQEAMDHSLRALPPPWPVHWRPATREKLARLSAPLVFKR